MISPGSLGQPGSFPGESSRVQTADHLQHAGLRLPVPGAFRLGRLQLRKQNAPAKSRGIAGKTLKDVEFCF
jgi:hypothetical protein